jgi:hypothetical protein
VKKQIKKIPKTDTNELNFLEKERKIMNKEYHNKRMFRNEKLQANKKAFNQQMLLLNFEPI